MPRISAAPAQVLDVALDAAVEFAAAWTMASATSCFGALSIKCLIPKRNDSTALVEYVA